MNFNSQSSRELEQAGRPVPVSMRLRKYPGQKTTDGELDVSLTCMFDATPNVLKAPRIYICSVMSWEKELRCPELYLVFHVCPMRENSKACVRGYIFFGWGGGGELGLWQYIVLLCEYCVVCPSCYDLLGWLNFCLSPTFIFWSLLASTQDSSFTVGLE